MKNSTHECDDDDGQLQCRCGDGDEEDDGIDDDYCHFDER